MARLAFGKPEARRRLESILHPRIRERWIAEAERWRGDGVPLGAVVIPLLFETDAASSFDAVVCVACSLTAQRERLKARGWNKEQIQQRIAAQWPIEKKIAASDCVVWTDADLEAHAAQWDRILTSL
jgi:dephospho-CoA kinase